MPLGIYFQGIRRGVIEHKDLPRLRRPIGEIVSRPAIAIYPVCPVEPCLIQKSVGSYQMMLALPIAEFRDSGHGLCSQV